MAERSCTENGCFFTQLQDFWCSPMVPLKSCITSEETPSNCHSEECNEQCLYVYKNINKPIARAKIQEADDHGYKMMHLSHPPKHVHWKEQPHHNLTVNVKLLLFYLSDMRAEISIWSEGSSLFGSGPATVSLWGRGSTESTCQPLEWNI
jgi:hypothetical protein